MHAPCVPHKVALLLHISDTRCPKNEIPFLKCLPAQIIFFFFSKSVRFWTFMKTSLLLFLGHPVSVHTGCLHKKIEMNQQITLKYGKYDVNYLA